MKEHERALKALANRRRLKIIKILKGCRSASVGELAEGIRLSLRSTSRHLRVLSSAGILENDQVGPYMLYRLSDRQPATAAPVIPLL